MKGASKELSNPKPFSESETGRVQGQVGWGLEQLDLVEDVPADLVGLGGPSKVPSNPIYSRSL